VHKLLARQLRAAARKDGGGVDVDALLAIVDQTYDEFDRERTLNDRAATLMEDELKAANAKAKSEHDAVLAAILNNASDGMLVVRDGGLIDIANMAAEKQFDAPAGGLVRQWIGKLLGPAARAVANGESALEHAGTITGTGLTGRVFPAECSIAMLDMSGGRRQLWIVRDISERARAQRELNESRTRFQDFAEASSDCFWEMDHNLSAVEVSSASEPDMAERLQALLSPAAKGEPPADVAEEGWRALRHHLSARQRFRLRLDVRRGSDETHYISVTGKPLFDPDGRFRGYRGTARDVTREVQAREAARRAERRLIEAMDAAPCAVAMVNAKLHLVGGNSALKTLASIQGERLPFGRPFLSFLSGALQAEALSGELLRRVAQTGEMREVAIGGGWYLVAARGLSEGGMVLTFSEVTALKQREGELAEAKLAAESASRLKSQFLATMSHELRTPLNAILGFSEVIRDSVFGKSQEATDKYSEYAGSIHTSGRHLLSLISEILDLSKIEAGSYVLDVKTHDLRDVLKGAITIISPAATKANVEVRATLPETPVWIAGDERAVRQIALNLFSNAVKFTPAGGHVSIGISSGDGFVEFSVTDTGIGIAKEHVDAVFELFRQVDSSIRRRHEGTGLGLAITKRLVELHGGTVTLDSEVAQGTTVRVKLPAGVAETSAAPSKEAAA
jgi:signal transduction histidine kinase